jgi:voltage-gated potassium channel
MFWISVLFLANTAIAIVLWVDIPRISEAYLRSYSAGSVKVAADGRFATVAVDRIANQIQGFTLIVAFSLWPVFVLEFLFYLVLSQRGRRFTRLGLLACFCPPLRLGVPNLEMRGRIWLPKLGWTRQTSKVRRKLEQCFGVPMITIALMILPILLIEFGLREHVAERIWLRILLHFSTGTIWFAFAFEFIIMCSVAPKKFQYCKEHWLDLVIILLPLLSFLRSLRVLRATRLVRLAKIQYLSKLGRVYRLRGLAIKGFRGLAVIELMNRILPMTLERQVELLEADLEENEREGRDLKRRIASIERLIAFQKSEAAGEATESEATESATTEEPDSVSVEKSRE